YRHTPLTYRRLYGISAPDSFGDYFYQWLDTQVGWKALAGAAPADLFQRDRGSDSLPLASQCGHPQTLGVCGCAGAVARVSPCRVAFSYDCAKADFFSARPHRSFRRINY